MTGSATDARHSPSYLQPLDHKCVSLLFPPNKPVCVRSMGENNVRNRSIYCFGDQSLFRISVQDLDIPSP
jgi:hypothetical protein